MNRTEKVLRDLLRQNRESFHIEYDGFLSNHMAHGLIALFKLGASEERMRDFYSIYSKIHSLVPREPPSNFFITKENWKEIKGQRKHFTNLYNFFSNEINRGGVTKMINQYFPQLMEGLSGSAFHPLIHLGYSLELNPPDEGTAAEGLAYLTYSYSSMGKPVDNQNKISDLFSLLSQLKEDKTFDDISNERFIDRMKSLQKEKYQKQLEKYDFPIDHSLSIEETIRLISITSVKVLLSSRSRDFFLLHGVTSMRSLKMILSILENDDQKRMAIRYFWRGLIATYIVQKKPSLNVIDEISEAPESWEKIISRAIQEEDEHRIKLVWACNVEEKENGPHKEYKQAASLVLQYKDWIF